VENERKVKEERENLKKKQNRYSEIVKEMYQPKVDKAKQLELLLQIEKRDKPAKPKVYSSSTASK
jgi:hypothetical protein